MKMAAYTSTTTATTTNTLGRRPLVWSHNTSYPGATGIHSEVSKKAQAKQATGQRQLDSNLSTIESIHRKELRSLRQHRKSMETSMLAYTQKMRKISSDRLLLAGSTGTGMGSGAESPASKDHLSVPPSESEHGIGTGALERLLAVNKDRDESIPSISSETKKNARDSVDSGIDVTETGTERKISEDRLFHVVRRTPPDPVKPDPKRRPASFHTIDSSAATVLPSADRHIKVTSGPSSLEGRSRRRQRRPGTAEKPNVSSLQLNNTPEDEDSVRKNSSSAAEESPDPLLAITPFPEFQTSPPSPFTPKTDRGRKTFTAEEEEPSKKKKSTKTRGEDYWSYRKNPQRRSLSVASPRRSSNDRRSPLRGSPRHRHIDYRLLRQQQQQQQQQQKAARSPRPAPRKTYYLPFRYSDAVDNVMRSFEDRLTGTAIRRVSETLPTLDLNELQSQRHRWSDETAKGGRRARTRARGAKFDEIDDVFGGLTVDALPRERSMSAPCGLDFVHGEGYTIEEEEEEVQGEDEEDGEEEEEDEEEEEGMEEAEETKEGSGMNLVTIKVDRVA